MEAAYPQAQRMTRTGHKRNALDARSCLMRSPPSAGWNKGKCTIHDNELMAKLEQKAQFKCQWMYAKLRYPKHRIRQLLTIIGNSVHFPFQKSCFNHILPTFRPTYSDSSIQTELSDSGSQEFFLSLKLNMLVIFFLMHMLWMWLFYDNFNSFSM